MTRRARPISSRLRTRALARGGVFSRRDAIDLGHHDMDLHLWVRTGQVLQATRGGYYLTPNDGVGWSDLTSPQQQLEHERRRALAVLHVVPECFAASHDTALRLHGLPTVSTPTACADVHLMATAATPTRPRRPGVKTHRMPAGTRTVLRPARAVSVADAIAQAGCQGGLIGALIPADAAVARGDLERAELDEAIARAAGLPGSTGLAEVVGLVDGRSESAGSTFWSTVRGQCWSSMVSTSIAVQRSCIGRRSASSDCTGPGT